jgi:UDP:flavonoid glycosyltransferase YjiC (YdhE family)
VCHGGFGTTFGALSHGLPVVCAPLGADQTLNADAVAAAGAGVDLGGSGVPSVADVTAAVRAVVEEPSYRARAADLAAEIAAGASPDEAAELVEGLWSLQDGPCDRGVTGGRQPTIGVSNKETPK